MSSYTDFLRQHAKENAHVRRLYWLFGEEEVFRLKALDQIKDMSEALPMNILTLSLNDTPETEVWAALNQHPLDSDQKRVVVIHEAQKLVHVDRMISWLKDNQTSRARNATAVFVSSDDEWDTPEKEVLSKSSTAQWVRCALPKNEGDRLKRSQEILVDWSGGSISPVVAAVLIERVNFDFGEADTVLRKAALFPGATLSVAAVETLAPRKPENDLVWSILSLNKRQAVEALAAGEPATSNILGALSTHVEMLGRINSVLTVSNTAKDAAKRIEAREQYVRILYPIARLYPRREVVRRTLLLGRIDDAAQRGAREGLLESLIALW